MRATTLTPAAIGVAIGLLMVGCGVPRQVRTDARLLSLYTQGVQRDAERFAKHRDLVAAARTRALNQLEESALTAEHQGTNDQLVWRLSDPERLKLYQSLLEGTTTALEQHQQLAAERERHAKAVAAARGGGDVRSAQLAKTAQTLAQLASRPDLRGDLDFYVGFFKEVRKQLDEAEKAAAEQAQKASGAAAKKTPVSNARAQ